MIGHISLGVRWSAGVLAEMRQSTDGLVVPRKKRRQQIPRVALAIRRRVCANSRPRGTRKCSDDVFACFRDTPDLSSTSGFCVEKYRIRVRFGLRLELGFWSVRSLARRLGNGTRFCMGFTLMRGRDGSKSRAFGGCLGAWRR